MIIMVIIMVIIILMIKMVIIMVMIMIIFYCPLMMLCLLLRENQLLTSTGQGNYFQIKTLLLPFGANHINLECLEDVAPHVIGHCCLSAVLDQPLGGGDTVIGIGHCTLCCCTKIHGCHYQC